MARRRLRPSVRTLGWLGVFAVVGIVAGYAAAILTVGGFGYTPHQTSVTGVPTPPVGVGFPLVEEVAVGSAGAPPAGACTVSNLGTPTSPTPLTSGTNTTICLSTSAGGFALGDAVYLTAVSWNSSAAHGTTYQVQVFYSVTPVTKDILATSYVSTSATITATEEAVFVADLPQSGALAVNGFSIIVTEG